jgi:hypothetical protein
MYFSTLERLFLVALGLVVIYALFSFATTVLRVWKTKASPHEGNTAGIQSTVSTLRARSVRLQMLIGAAFYLFGVVFFLGLQRAHITIDNSRTPVGLLVLENFQVRFAFAFNVFVAFFVLHVLGWFVSAMVRRLELRGLP